MEPMEVKRIVSKIKAYYYYFSLEKDSLNEWNYKLRDYDYEDVSERVEEHLKGEQRKEPPQLHYLISGLLTKEQKRKKNELIVACQNCGRWLPLSEYNQHYDLCLDIEYLVRVAREQGKNLDRAELENCKRDIIDKLLAKYPPNEIWRPQSI